MMAMVAIPAFATSVPSKTTQDLAKVVSFTSDSGASLGADFIIRLLEETESADATLKQLIDFVTGQKLSPVRFFDEKVQQTVASFLPEGTNLDSFVIEEFSPMIVENYKETYGDITAKFQFATEYADGQKMVALIGLVTGTDDEGKPVIEWAPIKAEAEGGLVKAHFPGDLLLRLDGQDAMIAILSENAA
jgi:hypothetical protein